MYDNPWRIDDIARMERERIRDEMRQIRLEEKALQARVKGPGLLAKALLKAKEWLKARETRPEYSPRVQPPLTLTQVKPHTGI